MRTKIKRNFPIGRGKWLKMGACRGVSGASGWSFGTIFFLKPRVLTQGSQWWAPMTIFRDECGNRRGKAFWGHNSDLGTRKRLPSPPIVLKWGDLSRWRKRGKSGMVNFDGRYLMIGGSDRRSAGADGMGKGETYWDDKWQAGNANKK